MDMDLWLIQQKMAQKRMEKIKNSASGNYDLVLMDVQMPVMNGYEATKEIRALAHPASGEGITILAMTANAFDEDRKKALECGMDGFLSKPIVIEELIAMLQKNIESGVRRIERIAAASPPAERGRSGWLDVVFDNIIGNSQIVCVNR